MARAPPISPRGSVPCRVVSVWFWKGARWRQLCVCVCAIQRRQETYNKTVSPTTVSKRPTTQGRSNTENVTRRNGTLHNHTHQLTPYRPPKPGPRLPFCSATDHHEQLQPTNPKPSDEYNEDGPTGSDGAPEIIDADAPVDSDQPPSLMTDSEFSASLGYSSTVSITTEEGGNQDLDGFDLDAFEGIDQEPDGSGAVEAFPPPDDPASTGLGHVVRGGDPELYRLWLALLAYIYLPLPLGGAAGAQPAYPGGLPSPPPLPPAAQPLHGGARQQPGFHQPPLHRGLHKPGELGHQPYGAYGPARYLGGHAYPPDPPQQLYGGIGVLHHFYATPPVLPADTYAHVHRRPHAAQATSGHHQQRQPEHGRHVQELSHPRLLRTAHDPAGEAPPPAGPIPVPWPYRSRWSAEASSSSRRTSPLPPELRTS